MIKSMTAFGRAKVEGLDKDITVEIKSVNSRYFDCTVKMPRSLSFLEERVKAYLQKNAVSRAKLDVYITVDSHENSVGTVSYDRGYAESYVAALRAMRDELGLADDITVMSVARNTEIFRTARPDLDAEAEWERLCAVLSLAVRDYDEMRTREGERIERDIKAKVEAVRAYTDEIEKISHEDTVGYRDKLEARLRAILADNAVTVDENRLLTECAIWADKIAIDEELVRLRSHFGAFYEIADGREINKHRF